MKTTPGYVGKLAGLLFGAGGDFVHGVSRIFRGSRYRPHEGHQERARRRHQIERGQLTGSNGLVVTPREAR